MILVLINGKKIKEKVLSRFNVTIIRSDDSILKRNCAKCFQGKPESVLLYCVTVKINPLLCGGWEDL